MTDTIILDRGEYTTCTVNLQGATVTSWRIRNQEQLFISRNLVFDPNKSLRGGITILFPHFGTWSFGLRHGFARIVPWNVEKFPTKLKNGDIEAAFSVSDDAFTDSMWNFKFKLIVYLVLKERELHFNIKVKNTSENMNFRCKIILRVYYRVRNIEECQIFGLQNCTYVDNTDIDPNALFQEVKTQEEEYVKILNRTDRFYRNTYQDIIITNAISARKMIIQKYNLPDTGLWNPWIQELKYIKNFDNDEYCKMLCIDSGYIFDSAVLFPNTIYDSKLIFQIT